MGEFLRVTSSAVWRGLSGPGGLTRQDLGDFCCPRGAGEARARSCPKTYVIPSAHPKEKVSVGLISDSLSEF